MTTPEFPASAPSPGGSPDAWARAAVADRPAHHRTLSRGRRRAMVAIATVGVFVAAPIAGYLSASSQGSTQSAGDVLTQLPSANAPASGGSSSSGSGFGGSPSSGFPSGGSSSGGFPSGGSSSGGFGSGGYPSGGSGPGGFPSGGRQSGGGSSSGSSAASSLDVASIAAQVEPSVVNIMLAEEAGGQAAGTGIVISSDGLVLTNNHVIDGATSVTVEFGSTGQTRSATVLGYDKADDVALIRVQNVSGLTAATLAQSSTLSIGDPIVAIGNAGGAGGTPSVVSGSVTGLDQQITASDQDGSNAETLNGLVETDANIQPGDSGGPLVNGSGQVVGMDAAASSTNGGYGFGGYGRAANQGYAIPIEDAYGIAQKILAGRGGGNIHIGGTRAVLGVKVQAGASSGGFGGSGSQGSGATVVGVASGSGAERAGITTGDTIVAVGNTSVSTASALSNAMTAYSPGDSVEVRWIDSSGTSHHATITAGSGAPA